ncbi:MAG TPA: Ig-like domain-containing protein, partial [Fibrella sp.]
MGTIFTAPAGVRGNTLKNEANWLSGFAAQRTLFQVPTAGVTQYGGFSPLAYLVVTSSNIAAVVAPTVNASKTDNVVSGTKKKAGDTINYSVTIGNSAGGADATGVQFSDTLDSNTTLVPGSFKSTPLAYPQTVATNEDNAKTITLTGLDPDGGALTFTLNGASPTKGTLGPVSQLTNTTAQVTYTPTSNLNGEDSFGFRVTDSDNNTNDDTLTIGIVSVNDLPALSAGAALNYTENDAASVIDNTITVSDIDNANLASATVQLTGNYVNGEDVLSFTNTATITGNFSASTGTLTLIGADTLANYQTALRSVKYNNTFENPSILARTVAWTVNDGTDASNSPTSTINVTAVNDAPTAAPKSGATYAAATNIQISFPASNGLLVDSTDPDRTTLSMDTTPVNVTNGAVVTLAADGGFTIDPPAGVTGPVSFQYRVQDSGSPAPNKFSAYTTVTVTVSGPTIFFADDNAVAGGTGTLARPLQTLVAATTAAINSGNRVFLYEGNYIGGVTLASGTLLYGQAVTGGSFDSALGISPPVGSLARPSINGTAPIITTSAAATNGVNVSTGNNTIAGVTFGNTTGSAIASGTSFGTLTVSGTSISTAATRTGQALDLTGGTLNGTFATLTASSAPKGISLTNVAGSLTATGGSLSGLTGDDIAINGGTIAVTYPGPISNTSGRSINISNKTASGNVTFSGSITDTGTGILLDNNDGATINFNGGLTLNTGTNAAFTAINGGTVNVTGTNLIGNSAALSNAGVRIADTNIGSSGVTFQKISTNNSGAPGITLSNTGNSGFFLVTGQPATAGSGGSITNSIGSSETTGTPGVRLNSVANVRLNFMNITGNNHSGIYGTTVNGFMLDNSSINNNGNTTTSSPDEVGVDITNLTGTAFNGTHPTGITNSTLSNNWEFQVQIANTTGTLTDFQLTSNTISSTGAGTLANMVNFLGTGTSAMKLTATGGTFTGNAPNTAMAIQAKSSGTSMTANVSGATFTNNNEGVNVSTGPGSTALTFNISGNTFKGTHLHAISHVNDGNAPFTRTVNGKILNNIIGTEGLVSSGSQTGDGILISNEGTINANLLISGNDIREIGVPGAITANTGGRAIFADNGVTSGPTSGGTTSLTITNNTMTNVYTARALIVSQTDYVVGAPAGNAGTVCANISGNTFAGTISGQVVAPGNAGNSQRMRLKKNSNATSREFKVTQFDFNTLATANTGVTTGQISISGSPTFNQPACAQPPLLFSAEGAVAASGSGCGVGSTPAGATTLATQKSVLNEENVLTQDKLDVLVQQAITQWEATGLTSEQRSALRRMKW